MAAIDFPDSPSDGQVFTVGNKSWTWSTTLNTWEATVVDIRNDFSVTTASVSSAVVRNITLSTSDPTGGIDGDIWIKY